MDNVPVVHGFSQRIDPASLYSTAQVEAIQAAACVIAGISLLGSLVAIYWFTRMKKKFRHNLIMILIVGDILRSMFLFIFPLISLVRGHIQTNTPFCQASGYLTQTGIEIADFAVLTIATHTLLQIVQPTVSGYGTLDNGLYRYRIAVYVLAAILPASWTALAFIGKNGGFVSQGPTCSLPLRPYWYRLAISWIPRYVIMLVVLAMYTVIYVRVGRQNGTFSFFGLFKVNKPWETVIAPSKLSIHEQQQDAVDGTNNRRKLGRHNLRVDTGNNGNHIDAYGPKDPVHLNLPAHAHTRKVSDGTTLVSQGSMEFGHTKPLLITPQFELNDPMAVSSFDGPTDSPSSRKKSVLIRVSERLLRSPISPGGSTPSPVVRPQEQQIIGKKIMTKHMRKRQDAIQRQLGLLFLYPVCYFITYVPPFVAHGMNYSNYYVQHPVFGLNLFSFICLASLGTVDAIVFSIRERPWRHIVGSDGTFWGSFRFWDNDGVRRTSDDSEVGNELSATDPTHSAETPLHSAAPGHRRFSTDRASRNSNASDNQRDSWITNMTSPIGLHQPNQPNRPKTTRVPSWSHFRTGSTVAAPILEEGDPATFLHSAIPNSPNPLLNGVPGSAVSAPGVVDAQIRGERWGSTYSGMSLGSEDGVDRELANMDRWLDRAIAREFLQSQRKGSEN